MNGMFPDTVAVIAVILLTLHHAVKLRKNNSGNAEFVGGPHPVGIRAYNGFLKFRADPLRADFYQCRR